MRTHTHTHRERERERVEVAVITEVAGEQLVTVSGHIFFHQLFGATFGSLGSLLRARAKKAGVVPVTCIGETQLGLLSLPLLHYSTLSEHRTARYLSKSGTLRITHKGA